MKRIGVESRCRCRGRDEEIKRSARDHLDGAMSYDRYSKTMTLHIIYQLIELINELRDVRNERDGLQLMLESYQQAESYQQRKGK